MKVAARGRRWPTTTAAAPAWTTPIAARSSPTRSSLRACIPYTNAHRRSFVRFFFREVQSCRHRRASQPCAPSRTWHPNLSGSPSVVRATFPSSVLSKSFWFFVSPRVSGAWIFFFLVFRPPTIFRPINCARWHSVYCQRQFPAAAREYLMMYFFLLYLASVTIWPLPIGFNERLH